MKISQFIKSLYSYHYYDSFSSKIIQLPAIVRETFTINYSNENWEAKFNINLKKMTKESGSTDQFKVTLTNGEKTLTARAKKIETLNEAISYYQIQEQKDPLFHFLPKFIGVFNEEGEQINLKDLLENNTIQGLCQQKKYHSLYLVMEDLLDTLQQTDQVTVKSPKDFKFVQKSLQGSDLEAELHFHKKANFFQKTIRKLFFSLSKCSFAFQKSTTSSWYTIIINYVKRALKVSKTKSVLEKQFKRLPSPQLERIKEKLEELHTALENSHYVMADSSLLFIPIEQKINGNNKQLIINDLEIKLIDLSYAFSVDELRAHPSTTKATEEYNHMKKEMCESIEELIDIVKKELTTRVINEFTTQRL